MALIVVMEDDAGTRMMVASVLKRDGHVVLGAEDAAKGLDLVRQNNPELIISDVQMPGMNGFQMLASLRQNPVTATTPVILLTSLQERAHIRIGMTTGADDYITKPFRPDELREAVASQLNKRSIQASLRSMAVDAAVEVALVEQKHQLAKLYEQRLASELSERWPSGAGSAGDERLDSATVLFADIPNHAALAEKLDAEELTDLVKKVYGNTNDTIQLFGARHIRFVGEGALAVFAASTDTHTVNHSLRAVRAAIGLVESGRGINKYLAARYPGRDLPPFEINVALHTGTVTLTLLADPLHGTAQVLPVGDAISVAILLQKQARALGWPVVASAVALRAIAGAVRTGQRAMLQLPGRSAPMDAVELVGLAL
ncbi:response regulator [Caenimonas terrae]|uniref:Response regulator n=1 Tax=Caenimonas terrae TaxID=696074 RepID=A0ABW0NIY1_9BURK